MLRLDQLVERGPDSGLGPKGGAVDSVGLGVVHEVSVEGGLLVFVVEGDVLVVLLGDVAQPGEVVGGVETQGVVGRQQHGGHLFRAGHSDPLQVEKSGGAVLELVDAGVGGAQVGLLGTIVVHIIGGQVGMLF